MNTRQLSWARFELVLSLSALQQKKVYSFCARLPFYPDQKHESFTLSPSPSASMCVRVCTLRNINFKWPTINSRWWFRCLTRPMRELSEFYISCSPQKRKKNTVELEHFLFLTTNDKSELLMSSLVVSRIFLFLTCVRRVENVPDHREEESTKLRFFYNYSILLLSLFSFLRKKNNFDHVSKSLEVCFLVTFMLFGLFLSLFLRHFRRFNDKVECTSQKLPRVVAPFHRRYSNTYRKNNLIRF